MQIERGFADINGTQLYYEVAGSGHPLVLIHGFGADSRQWNEQFQAFAQYYQVLRYDVRGFGKSQLPPSEPYCHSDDLKALMEHVSLPSAYVLGLSMGGRIAIGFAVKYPELTDALIPVGAALYGYQMQEFTLALIAKIAVEDGIDAAKSAFLNHPLLLPSQERSIAGNLLADMLEDYSGWHLTHQDSLVIPDPSDMERLGSLKVSILAIVGERDLSDFHRIADILEERIEGARKLVVPDIGHVVNMEAPERFNEIVLEFLGNQ